jgi:hypothetical protein
MMSNEQSRTVWKFALMETLNDEFKVLEGRGSIALS